MKAHFSSANTGPDLKRDPGQDAIRTINPPSEISLKRQPWLYQTPYIIQRFLLC